MVRKLFFILLLAVFCSGAASAAADVLNSGCFDGAAACTARVPFPVPPPAPPVPLAAKKAVVISIVGVNFTKIGFGKLERAYIKDIVEQLKPGAQPDESLFAAGMDGAGEAAALSGDDWKYHDDYLDANLAKILPGEEYEIVPVRWSRDPEDSVAAVLLTESVIKKVFAEARAEGRPVYLVAHSWGTVLAHTALNMLAVSDPEVRIDKLITMGSPLVPGYWWMNIFMELEINAGQLQAYVTKPKNTGHWLNVWARNDYFSNLINAADQNLIADDWTLPLEARIRIFEQADPSLHDKALLDLFLLKNPQTWHFAYVFDFRIFLRTLQERYEKYILGPVVSGELLSGRGPELKPSCSHP